MTQDRSLFEATLAQLKAVKTAIFFYIPEVISFSIPVTTCRRLYYFSIIYYGF